VDVEGEDRIVAGPRDVGHHPVAGDLVNLVEGDRSGESGDVDDCRVGRNLKYSSSFHYYSEDTLAIPYAFQAVALESGAGGQRTSQVYTVETERHSRVSVVEAATELVDL